MSKFSKPSVAILAGACAVLVPAALSVGPSALEMFAGALAPGAAATTRPAIPSPSTAITPVIRTVGIVGGTGGVAIVFNRPDGAFGFGHVGWGVYDPNSGQWTYGSVENQSGQPNVPAGDDNGAWSQTGDFGDMTNAMNARGYSQAVSIPVTDPDLAAALSDAAAQPGEGYNLFGNNCADAVWNLLNAYGAQDLGLLQLTPAPNDWFQDLSDQSANQPFSVPDALKDPSSWDPAESYPGGYVDDPSDTGGNADDGGQLAYNGDNGDGSDDAGGYGDGGGGGGDCGPLEMAAFTAGPATSTAGVRPASIVLTDDAACG